jgi:phospholipid transport system substrate-binding protein
MCSRFNNLTRKRKLIAAPTLALLAVFIVARAEGAQDPMMVVKSLVDAALRILAYKQTPLRERQEKLRALVNNNFDFGAMSRSALGYHWSGLSDSQRKDFTPVFTTFIQDSYLNKIQDYSGQQVQFLGESQPDPGYAEVKSQMVQPGRQPIQLKLRAAPGQR